VKLKGFVWCYCDGQVLFLVRWSHWADDICSMTMKWQSSIRLGCGGSTLMLERQCSMLPVSISILHNCDRQTDRWSELP